MINRFLVALEESKLSENGVGWTKPFDKSANFKTSIDVAAKLLNSTGPKNKKRKIKEDKNTTDIHSSCLKRLLRNNKINRGKYAAIKKIPLSILHKKPIKGRKPIIIVLIVNVFFVSSNFIKKIRNKKIGISLNPKDNFCTK